METNSLRVLITGGGTNVRIDDVRHLSNFSRGGFAAALGRAFIQDGAQVTLLASTEMIERMGHLHETDGYTRIIPYDWFEEYEQKLFQIIKEEQPDVILMAAAVSDWVCKDVQQGKISSDKDELTLTFIRAPKLIARVREATGIKTFLVGFKLLSGALEAELLNKAYEQVTKNRLNLTVANDLHQIKEGQHPVTLVTPEGGEIPLSGKRERVAHELVAFIKRRQAVRWSREKQTPNIHQLDADSVAASELSSLLTFTKDARIFQTVEGNLSWRAQASEHFWVSPCKVLKAALKKEDLVYTSTDAVQQVVSYEGQRRPSIDSCVQGVLYQTFPWIQGLLHFHTGFVLEDASTCFPYPCGTQEEAEEIAQAIDLNSHSEGVTIVLPHHGYLIAFPEQGAVRLAQDWAQVKTSYLAHLTEVGYLHCIEELSLSPVFHHARIVGLVASHFQEQWVSCYLHPDNRGQGYGDRLVQQIEKKGLRIKADRACQVLDYYRSRGWTVAQEEGSLVLLDPPKLFIKTV